MKKLNCVLVVFFFFWLNLCLLCTLKKTIQYGLRLTLTSTCVSSFFYFNFDNQMCCDKPNFEWYTQRHLAKNRWKHLKSRLWMHLKLISIFMLHINLWKLFLIYILRLMSQSAHLNSEILMKHKRCMWGKQRTAKIAQKMLSFHKFDYFLWNFSWNQNWWEIWSIYSKIFKYNSISWMILRLFFIVYTKCVCMKWFINFSEKCISVCVLDTFNFYI